MLHQHFRPAAGPKASPDLGAEQVHVNAILEALNWQCPHCSKPSGIMDACVAVQCEHCRKHSCWYCEAKIFGDSHEHCRVAHGGYSYIASEDHRFTKIRVHRKVTIPQSSLELATIAKHANTRTCTHVRAHTRHGIMITERFGAFCLQSKMKMRDALC